MGLTTKNSMKFKEQARKLLGNPWRSYKTEKIKTLNGIVKVLVYTAEADGRKSVSLDDALLMRGMEQHGTGKCIPASAKGLSGNLYFTAMGRITLDDHNGEVYCEPHDKVIMTKEELTRGIKALCLLTVYSKR